MHALPATAFSGVIKILQYNSFYYTDRVGIDGDRYPFDCMHAVPKVRFAIQF